MRSVSHQPSVRWPFWLLLVAWVCANNPQAATYAVLTWLHEAGNFSHQRVLTAEVAHILAGEKTPDRPRLAVNETLPAKPKPAVPANVVLKKIELAVESTVDVLPPALRGNRPEKAQRVCPDSLRAPPPHEPPRASVA